MALILYVSDVQVLDQPFCRLDWKKAITGGRKLNN